MADIKAKVTDEFLAALPIQGRSPSNEKEEKFMREICEFEFYNLEEPGLSVKFPYGSTRNKHTFNFFHGAKYRVPRFLAQYLETRSTPIWDWRPDPEGTGRMTKQRMGDKPRFQMRQVYS